MTKTLAGKVALVTGGSRGIGAAIAMRFAADGADVAISYAASPDRAKQVAKQIESEGARAFAVKADQADPKQVIDPVKSVHAHFGKLDILVNNAGSYITGVVGDPAADMT